MKLWPTRVRSHSGVDIVAIEHDDLKTTDYQNGREPAVTQPESGRDDDIAGGGPMVVTFAGYDIKVGTPVMSRDGKEIGSVKATDSDDLVVSVHNDEKPLVVSERGVAAFEPDFVRLAQSADWIQKGQWKVAPAAGVRTLGGYTPEPAPAAAPLAASTATATKPPASTPTATSTLPPINGSSSISKVAEETPEDSDTMSQNSTTTTATATNGSSPATPTVNGSSSTAAPLNGTAVPDTDQPAASAGPAQNGVEQAHAVKIHAENLVAKTREVASGAVTVRKRVVIDDESLDVDVFEEKVKVTRRDLDNDADVDHVFEDSTFEIELLKEAIDVSTRVRVVGQVALDKHRVTRTEKVSGQVRREEVDVDQVEYPEVRKPGASS